jgi:CDP-glycerol glycerophosphotransferase
VQITSQAIVDLLLSLKRRRPGLFKAAKLLVWYLSFIPALIVTILLKTIDLLIPKSPKRWVFPVHFFMHTFSDNSRAVYEAALDRPDIIKIILTRGKSIDCAARSDTVSVPMLSLAAMWHLLRARVIVIQHSVYMDLAPLRMHRRFFFNLTSRIVFNTWHGIPVKSLLAKSSGIHIRPINREKKHHHLCASSSIDKLAMTVSFYPVPPSNVHVTGAPRNDFLRISDDELPSYCQKQLAHIRNMTKQRKLVVYAPTYRELQLGGHYYSFSNSEINQLKKILRDNDAVLGLRLHYFNRQVSYADMIDGELVFEMDQSNIPDMAMLIREAHIVITDYSGLFVDALYLGRPVVSFAYDRTHYMKMQRGFVYSLETISPLPVCESFDALMKQVSRLLSGPNDVSSIEYSCAQRIFFDRIDSDNGRRTVDCILSLVR